MAKEATLQVRMDADLKEEAEKLYHDMGDIIGGSCPYLCKTKRIAGRNAIPDIIYQNGKYIWKTVKICR